MSSGIIHLKRLIQCMIVIILCLSLFVIRQGTVQAATYTVTSASDVQTTCGTAPNGTLRWAVCSAVAAGDVITINPVLTITLGAALPQLTNTNLTIQGSGSAVDGAGTYRVFDIAAGANIRIDSLTIQRGFDGVQGGGINNAGTLTLTASKVAANSTNASGFNGGDGGGIYNSGTLTITNSTVSGNSANNNAGAGGDGGGIHNAVGGSVTLINSTLSGNSASNGGGIGGSGGGIFNFGTVTITNSTLSGNSSKGGGGIFNFGTMTITNSTLSGNSTIGVVGGINNIGTLTLNNSLVTSSVNGNCSGTFTSNGAAYNLSDDNTCGANVTQVTAAQLNLGSLGSNGGPTQTIPLLAGSIAIGQGQPAICTLAQPNGAGGLDQRGVTRKSPCDIGAYEIPSAPTVNSASAVAPVVPLCSLIGGGVDTIVRANVPNNTITDGSVFCRVLNKNGTSVTGSDEIGNLSVLQRGVIEAVDVFGLHFDGAPVVPFNTPVQVCLQGSGTLLFLDAVQSPRTVSSPAASSQSGYTCANIPNAGMVVLVNDPSAPTTSTSSAGMTALTACLVTTTHIVNLRSEPGTDSAVLTQVPYKLTLRTDAHQGDWYRAVYGSHQGWINAQFLNIDPSCG